MSRAVRQTRDKFPVIGAIAGPTVQKHYGRAGAGDVISEPKAIGLQGVFHRKTPCYLIGQDHIECFTSGRQARCHQR